MECILSFFYLYFLVRRNVCSNSILAAPHMFKEHVCGAKLRLELGLKHEFISVITSIVILMHVYLHVLVSVHTSTTFLGNSE